MNELWNWIRIGLVLGGVAVALVGIVWLKTAKLVRFFGGEVNPDGGFWIMMSGAALMVMGMALIYFL